MMNDGDAVSECGWATLYVAPMLSCWSVVVVVVKFANHDD